MAREYFCCYHSYLEVMEQLNDTERGRLFTACLMYSKTGEVPELRGNERFVFPAFRSQIDRDNANYEETCKKRSASANARWNANDANASKSIPNDANNAKEKEKEKEKTKEKEKEKIKEKAASGEATSSRFVPPTVEVVQAYCLERKNGIDAQSFVDFYSSKNWMVGKNKMSDWKAAMRTWERRKQEGGNANGSNAGNSGGSGKTQKYGTYL